MHIWMANDLQYGTVPKQLGLDYVPTLTLLQPPQVKNKYASSMGRVWGW